MSKDPDNVSRFWQELKRRKVIRVITVYIAVSLAILELVSNISEPFGLPVWTLKLVFVILVVGLILSVILSWIYDIHPEGGIIKTEPFRDGTKKEKPSASTGWKVATYLSIAVILALILVHILSGNKGTPDYTDLEKSIAVLPFDNFSSDEEYAHLGAAFTDEIIMELQKIKSFDRVLSRSSTMQYESSRPSIPEIAEKLDVSYLVEGSIQRQHDKLHIIVQVIRGINEDHIWAQTYDGEWKDIFSFQARIAADLAKQLSIVLSPEEHDLIDKIPTASLDAFDFYQQAEEFLRRFREDPADSLLLEKANNLYHRALQLDPSFAKSYVGLAKVYWSRNFRTEYFTENFLDSFNFYLDEAQNLDNQLAEVYLLRGNYYSIVTDTTAMLREYNRVLELNPNSWEAYYRIGDHYRGRNTIISIENLIRAAQLNQGPETADLMVSLSLTFALAGFYPQSRSYWEKALELNGDSLDYFNQLASNENWQGNHLQSIDYSLKALKFDSLNVTALDRLAYCYMFEEDFQTSLIYYRKVEDQNPPLRNLHRIGYVLEKTGFLEESNRYYTRMEELYLEVIRLGRIEATSSSAYYDLAALYAHRGQTEKAMEYLRIFDQVNHPGEWIVTLIHEDPLFDNLRGDPEFEQIVRDVERKFSAEYEQTRLWLEENNLL